MNIRTLSFPLAAWWLGWGLFWGLLACSPSVRPASAAERLELRDGDRVVLLGGTFIERLQLHGNLEFLLTAGQPHKNLSFRNLGWSGDNVFGLSRAVFGSQAEGFARLKKDVAEAKPTLIIIAYGANEANAGEVGVGAFTSGLNGLLDALRGTGARLALLSPTKRENLGPPLPDPTAYNESLRLYRNAIHETAQKRNLPFVDLTSLIGGPSESSEPQVAPLDQLTDNGLHLSSYGDWRAAPRLAAMLGVPAPSWSIDLDLSRKSFDAVGLSILDVGPTPGGFKLTIKDDMLPLPGPPPEAPEGAERVAPPRTLRLRGLAAGKYEVRIDGQVVASVNEKQLAAGVSLTRGPEFEQAAELLRLIEDKNVLYFHRYRPQNETYLFLFRKHEQGNNAVEIPQFDPLVAEKEKRIAELKQPRPRVYEIVAK